MMCTVPTVCIILCCILFWLFYHTTNYKQEVMFFFAKNVRKLSLCSISTHKNYIQFSKRSFSINKLQITSKDEMKLF